MRRGGVLRGLRGLCLGLALGLSLVAGEAPAQVLALEEVLEAVDRAYPPLQAAAAEQTLAEGDLLSARGAFDPVLRLRGGLSPLGDYTNGRLDVFIEQPTPLWGASLLAGYRLGLGTFADYDGKLKTGGQGELRAGLSVPLWRNGPTDRRRANIRRAELSRTAADLGLTQGRLEAVRLATQRYYEWVAAGQRLQVARRLLALARERDEALAERVARGDLPAIERTDNARALAQREGLVVAAERGLEQAAIELGLYLRGPDGAPRPPGSERLSGGLPEAGPAPAARPEETASALTRRPEPRRFRALAAQGEVERDLARNQLAPAIDLSVVASRDLALERNAIEAGVYFDLPVPGRTARGRIRAAEATVTANQARARFAEDRVAAEVRDARSAWQAAQGRLDMARRELQLAQEVADGERARYQMGEGTLLFVNLREQAAAEAALREIDALLDGLRARAAYRAATGTL